MASFVRSTGGLTSCSCKSLYARSRSNRNLFALNREKRTLFTSFSSRSLVRAQPSNIFAVGWIGGSTRSVPSSSFCNNAVLSSTIPFWYTRPRKQHQQIILLHTASTYNKSRSNISHPWNLATEDECFFSYHQKRNNATTANLPPIPRVPNETNTNKRVLNVAIVGMPNAGKSQLLNTLIGTPLAAVSRKRHTTRNGILGVRNIIDSSNPKNSSRVQKTQLCFIDTPGFLTVGNARRENIMRSLMVTANDEMVNADVALLVIDAAKKMTEDVKATLVTLMVKASILLGDETKLDKDEINSLPNKMSFPFAIVLNKVDLIHPKKQLIDIAYDMSIMALKAQELSKLESGENALKKAPGDKPDLDELEQQLDTGTLIQKSNAKMQPPVFMVSALENDGVDDILTMLTRLAVNTPHDREWVVPEGEGVTDMSPEEQVEEIIREKIYRCLHKEIPHAIRQSNSVLQLRDKRDLAKDFELTELNKKVDDWGHLDKVLKIQQQLIVARKSQQRILIGKNGTILNRIKSQSQTALETHFKCTVLLDLQVVVNQNKSLRVGPLAVDERVFHQEIL